MANAENSAAFPPKKEKGARPMQNGNLFTSIRLTSSFLYFTRYSPSTVKSIQQLIISLILVANVSLASFQ